MWLEAETDKEQNRKKMNPHIDHKSDPQVGYFGKI